MSALERKSAVRGRPHAGPEGYEVRLVAGSESGRRPSRAARWGIRSNAVLPGVIDTDIMEGVVEDGRAMLASYGAAQ